MKVDKLFFKVASFLNIMFWGLAGVIVLSSNYYGLNAFNFIIGFLFVFVSLFWAIKYKNYVSLHSVISANNDLKQRVDKVTRDEYIFIILSGLLGFMLFMGSSARLFGEHASVFG